MSSFMGMLLLLQSIPFSMSLALTFASFPFLIEEECFHESSQWCAECSLGSTARIYQCRESETQSFTVCDWAQITKSTRAHGPSPQHYMVRIRVDFLADILGKLHCWPKVAMNVLPFKSVNLWKNRVPVYQSSSACFWCRGFLPISG